MTHTPHSTSLYMAFFFLLCRFHRRSRLALHCGEVAVSHPSRLRASTFSGDNTIHFAWTINPALLNDLSLEAEEACDHRQVGLQCAHMKASCKHGAQRLAVSLCGELAMPTRW